MVVEAIVKNLHQKVFDEVLSRANIPTEFGTREELVKTSEELQRVFNDIVTRSRLEGKGGDFFHFVYAIIDNCFKNNIEIITKYINM